VREVLTRFVEPACSRATPAARGFRRFKKLLPWHWLKSLLIKPQRWLQAANNFARRIYQLLSCTCLGDLQHLSQISSGNVFLDRFYNPQHIIFQLEPVDLHHALPLTWSPCKYK